MSENERMSDSGPQVAEGVAVCECGCQRPLNRICTSHTHMGLLRLLRKVENVLAVLHFLDNLIYSATTLLIEPPMGLVRDVGVELAELR